MDITFLLNGENVELRAVDPTRSVLDWLRDERHLNGTKEGCNEGDCGACTVIIADADGARAQNACIMMLGHLAGKSLITVEGLSGPQGQAHPVQTALVDHHGSQCGFCTPGIAVSLAVGHLNGRKDFDDQLAGNLCRCTGYAPIIRAADSAAEQEVPDWFAPRIIEALPDSSDAHLPATADDLATLLMEKPHATLVAGATDVGLWLTKRLQSLQDVIFLHGVRNLANTVGRLSSRLGRIRPQFPQPVLQALDIPANMLSHAGSAVTGVGCHIFSDGSDHLATALCHPLQGFNENIFQTVQIIQ